MESKRYLTCDFSGLEAGSADVLALGVAINEGADSLDIGVPTATGTTVRVRDIVAKARAFATDIAY